MKRLLLAAASFSLLAGAAPAQSAEGAGRLLRTESSYRVYELSFERDGMTIYGALYLPASGNAPYPVAIIAHGYNSSYMYTAAYAQDLAEEGIAAYVFDFCGGSPRSRSDGSTLDMSVLTEERDMETVLDGILASPFADSSRVFLMGESQGGFVASLLAEKQRDDVRGMALLYPAFVIPDDAREWFKSRDDIPATTDMGGMSIGKIYFEDVYDMDVYSALGEFMNPVLIVHGDADTVVPLTYSERMSQVYGDCTLHVIRGAGHGFMGDAQKEASREVIAFLKKLL